MKTTSIALLFALVLSACAPAATSTPLPTATPVPPATVTPVPPTAALLEGRGNPAMAYDARADRVILFGGTRAWPMKPLSDTWAYDPVAKRWLPMHPAQSPQGLGTMVYDSHAGRMILYVSFASDTTGSRLFELAPLGETWSYEFQTDAWTNLNSANTPDGLAFARLAYDSESDRVILFGGDDLTQAKSGAVPMSAETWAYDYGSNTWTKMSPKVHPPGRDGQGMTYDAAADRVIIFGGDTGVWSKGADTSKIVNDTWAYDYNADAWTEMKPATNPPPRSYGFLVHDADGQRDILVGGEVYQENTPFFSDTWAYDFKSNTWKALSPLPKGFELACQGMAVIPATKQIIAHVGGGSLYHQDNNVYWLYDLVADQWQIVFIQP